MLTGGSVNWYISFGYVRAYKYREPLVLFYFATFSPRPDKVSEIAAAEKLFHHQTSVPNCQQYLLCVLDHTMSDTGPQNEVYRVETAPYAVDSGVKTVNAEKIASRLVLTRRYFD
jgi:hypothetical protein